KRTVIRGAKAEFAPRRGASLSSLAGGLYAPRPDGDPRLPALQGRSDPHHRRRRRRRGAHGRSLLRRLQRALPDRRGHPEPAPAGHARLDGCGIRRPERALMDPERSRQLGQGLMALAVVQLLLFLLGTMKRSYAALALPIFVLVAAFSAVAFWVGWTMSVVKT